MKYIFWKLGKILGWGEFKGDKEASKKAGELGSLFYARWNDVKKDAPKETKDAVEKTKFNFPRD